MPLLLLPQLQPLPYVSLGVPFILAWQYPCSLLGCPCAPVPTPPGRGSSAGSLLSDPPPPPPEQQQRPTSSSGCGNLPSVSLELGGDLVLAVWRVGVRRERHTSWLVSAVDRGYLSLRSHLAPRYNIGLCEIVEILCYFLEPVWKVRSNEVTKWRSDEAKTGICTDCP
jgi:hypothetical protein